MFTTPTSAKQKIREAREIPASRFPSGTLSFLEKANDGKHHLRSMRLERGKVRATSREQPSQRASVTLWGTSASGDKTLFFDYNEGTYYLITVPGGVVKKLPNPRMFSRKNAQSFFHHFALSKQYLSFSNTEERERTSTSIIEVDTGRVCWKAQGVGFPLWSGTEDHFVFIRCPMQRETKTTVPQTLADLQFFRVTMVNGLASAERRISLTEATRLLGAWYPAVLEFALQKDFIGSLLDGDSIGAFQPAPGNTGFYLLPYDSVLNPQPPSDLPPLPPNNLDYDGPVLYWNRQGKYLAYTINRFTFSPRHWSRDGMRLYGVIEQSVSMTAICFWVEKGEYALVALPEQSGHMCVIGFLED
jgi:hypothetical protein